MPSQAIVRSVLVAVLGLCALAAAPSPDSRAPRADVSFWVNPDTSAARQASAWLRQGRFSDGWALARIAVRPQAEWLSKDGPEPVVRSLVRRAAAAGRTAVLVTYFIPDRDCGAYSAGGARDAAHYRAWIDRFAAGLGAHGAYVIVEPDAVALAVAGCAGADTDERYGLLAYAVDRLKRQPGTKVYVDAGNATWIPQVKRLVAPLRQAGVDRADGFALNVSNFHTDAVSAEYGHRLARALGGDPHFVIDSSRNGNGPYAGAEPWCNPPGRALGTAPTTRTGVPAVDAYLWVKRPGESDGTCRGGPVAGGWWPRYALELARNSRI
ncbi:glycoside hydrolase family 6 protein [Streptomyces sp. MNP-20]|uniref:glycoside hydrolase family 6 protein n=1 Tax=Streptomyces sp. MNP-20 TaxID=2721165 RepID=UPI001555987C|nr:glycoside hydrolase family 6 protein [Streptomyces sp. MNP-20]